MLGLYTASPIYPTRIDIQRSLVVDTAIFVVASAILNILVGSPIILVMSSTLSCDLIAPFTSILNTTSSVHDSAQQANFCSPKTDIIALIVYAAVLWLASVVAGQRTVWVISRYPKLFAAIYGPYYQLVDSNNPYVVADVLTKISYEGRMLIYEGELIELSLKGSREINFVCLQGARRLYLSLPKNASTTTPRHQVKFIDKDMQTISRITIPGSEILNIVTRTTDQVMALNTKRSMFQKLIDFLSPLKDV